MVGKLLELFLVIAVIDVTITALETASKLPVYRVSIYAVSGIS
jgi:hypothetical protein